MPQPGEANNGAHSPRSLPSLRQFALCLSIAVFQYVSPNLSLRIGVTMDYNHPPSDNKHDPYSTEFTLEPSSSNYRPPPLHRSSSSSPTLGGYPDEKNNMYTMNYNEHDSPDDPTNVRQSRTYPGHDTLDAAGPSEYSRAGYSDGDIHRGYPAAEDSAEALLVRNSVQSQKKARFQDLGRETISSAESTTRHWHLLFVEYADPTNMQPRDSESKDKPLTKFFEGAKYPLAQRIENKKRGIGRQKHPIVGECWEYSTLLNRKWTMFLSV